MLSLRTLANDETIRPPDYGERLPSSSDLSPPIEDLPAFRNPFDRIAYCLRSSNPNLVLWALSRVQIDKDRERRILQLLPFITTLLAHTSRVVEFAAVLSLTHLLRQFTKSIAGSTLTILVDRFSQTPAVEYIACLSAIIPSLTEMTLSSCILPLIDRFLAKSPPYHWAIGRLITSVPLSAWRATPDFFAKLLSSPVLVNDILPPFLPSIIHQKVLTEEWCTRIFPAQVLATAGVNRAIRLGAVKMFLYLWESGLVKSMPNGLGTVMQWAEDSLEIAVIVLGRADELVTPRTQELFPKVRDLLGKLGKSRDPHVRMRLPAILMGNPTVFLQGTLNVESLITGLAADKTPEVRLMCLNHFLGLAVHQDAFFKLFADYFVDPEDDLRDRLCSVTTYGHLTAARRASLAPIIMNFFSTLTEWRNMRDCIETMLSFPREVLASNWEGLSTLVFAAVAEYPNPLTHAVQEFCLVLAGVLNEGDCKRFCEKIRLWFLKSGMVAMRRIFPVIVTEMVVSGKANLDAMVQELSVLAADPISSVKTAVIRHLTRLRQHYLVCEDAGKEREIVSLFMALGESDNQHVADVWGVVWKVFQESRSPVALRASGFQTLPVSLSLRTRPSTSAPKVLVKGAMMRRIGGSKTVATVMGGPQLVRPKLPDSPFG